jgi:hypothetical protein
VDVSKFLGRVTNEHDLHTFIGCNCLHYLEGVKHKDDLAED